MGTTAWGGLGKGECLLCNGWFWCGGRPLPHPSLLLLTAVPPKLSGVLIIRLCGRTTQPSATPASPPVSMRGTINPELHSVLLKETKRWYVGTQPRESNLTSRLGSVSSPGIVWKSIFAEMLQTPGVSVFLDPVFLMVATQSQGTRSAQTTPTVSAETRPPPAFAADGRLGALQVLGSVTLRKTAVPWTNAGTRSAVALTACASTSVTVQVTVSSLVTTAPPLRVTLVLAINPFVLSYKLTLSEYLANNAQVYNCTMYMLNDADNYNKH